jgi:hypothetical protein
MSSGRKILCSVIVLLLLLAVGCLALTMAARQYLPGYLSRLATEKLRELTGMAGQIRVRQAWLHGADLADIRIGPPQDPVLEIRTVRIAYSPMQLYRTGEIDLVRICGLDVFAELYDGRLQLKNRKMMDFLTGRQARHERESTGAFRPPLSIALLMAEGGLRVDGLSARQERVPFHLILTGIGNRAGKAVLQAVLTPRGQQVALTARMSGRRMKLNVVIHDLVLEAFSGLQLIPERVELGGRLSLRAVVGVDLETPDLLTASAQCRIADLKAETSRFRFRSQSAEIPCLLDIATEKPGRWKVRGSGLSMASPVPLNLEEAALDLHFTAGGVKATGRAGAVFFPGSRRRDTVQRGVSVKPLALSLDIAGEYSSKDHWQIDASTGKHQGDLQTPLVLHYGKMALKAKPPKIACRVRGVKNGGRTDLEIEIPGVELLQDNLKATVSSVQVKSSAQFSTEPHTAVKGSAELDLKRFGLKSVSTAMALGKLLGQADFAFDAPKALTFKGRVVVSDGRVTLPDDRLRVTGISGRLPLRWPASEKGRAGSFSTGPVVLRGEKLGTLKGSLGQTESGLAFKAVFSTDLVSQLVTSLKGTFDILPAGNSDLHLKFDMSRPETAPEIDVAGIVPGVSGLFAGGGVRVHGEISGGGACGIGGHLAASWKDGWLRMPREKMRIDGIQATLNLPELPDLRSAPAQPIRFDRAVMGDFELKNGSIDFQLESFRSLLIEKSRFRWCRGIVEVPAFRIAPETDDYRLTLYCDRLNLAEVLGQLGIDAEGKGALNGRIPVHWSGGRLDFQDGFLFSTPGQGGKIRIIQSDILTAGVAPDSPEYNQMALASEALKDYDYTWARLNLNTEGEDLLLRLQLDGRPAGVLPFVYRKEKSGFVRVREGAKGSHFQGIRLDVNFRLPIDRLLRYSDIIPIMK